VFEIVYTVDHSQHKHYSSSFYTWFGWMRVLSAQISVQTVQQFPRY